MCGLLRQKRLVELDWVSAEDGSHILTVATGSKIFLYSAVAADIAQSAARVDETNNRVVRPRLQKSKSIVAAQPKPQICWMKLRTIELQTADSLPALPMHVVWVRDGVLVVGLDNEMHVYSQWPKAGITARNEINGYDSVSGLKKPIDVQGINQEEESRVLTEEKVTLSSVSSVSYLKSVQSTATYKMSKSTSRLFDDESSTIQSSVPSSQQQSPSRSPMISSRAVKSQLSTGSTTKSETQASTALGMLQEAGLFEAAQIANPSLPQYHPKLLMELLNFGKVKRVKAILAHLTLCIAGSEAFYNAEIDDESEDTSTGVGRSQSRLSYTGDLKTQKSFESSPDADLNTSVNTSITPLPIYAVIAADTAEYGGAALRSENRQDYNELMRSDALEGFDEAELDFELSTSPMNRRASLRRSSTLPRQQNPTSFSAAEARLLAKHLTYIQLPGLSRLDQMHLLALADTVANVHTELSDRFTEELTSGSVDNCGLRFMLAMQHHIYLGKALPFHQRTILYEQGISPSNIVWAFHSESTEELLNAIPGIQRNEPTWAELSQFGVGWWVRNINILKTTMEKVAKASFKASNDPMDAAIFYMAMKKKVLVWGLFRSIGDTRMVEFFKQDFTIERWRKAALKNAFALLGRQRFEHATALFLLAGSLNDAVEVCLNKLNDIQLAMVIARLYESELDSSAATPMLKRILYSRILGHHDPDLSQGKNHITLSRSTNPFLRSMAFWCLKQPNDALQTLLEEETPKSRILGLSSQNENTLTSVFNFYNFLRTHPIIVRQHVAADKNLLLSGVTDKIRSSTIDAITPRERRLYFKTAHSHFKAACPMLALAVLRKLPPVIGDEDMNQDVSSLAIKSKNKSLVRTGTFEDPTEMIASIPQSEPAQSSNDFDWGQPDFMSTPFQPVSTDDFPESNFFVNGIDRSDSEHSETETAPEPIKNPNTNASVFTTPVVTESKSHDLIAEQLKFIACLKILTEELACMATGLEVEGSNLRNQLYTWLERQVLVLKHLCGIETGISLEGFGSTSEDSGTGSSPSSTVTPKSPTVLHEVLRADKLDLDAKLERLAARKQWLLDNQQFLRTLLSYCCLYGYSSGSLASVRMELVLLLQELQQESSYTTAAGQQLSSPIPIISSIPLVSASLSNAKTVIANPIRHLQNTVCDIMQTVCELHTGPPTHSTPYVQYLRSFGLALSGCIYQCLSDCDTATTGRLEEARGILASVDDSAYKSAAGQPFTISPPSKWPGVTQWCSLLSRIKSEDSPRLNLLLSEAFVSVYISLLIHALAAHNASMLYRLVSVKFSESMWAALFGVCVRHEVKTMSTPSVPRSSIDETSKQRSRLHARLMGPPQASPSEPRVSYQETFVPPEISMLNYFLTKPNASTFIYSSAAPPSKMEPWDSEDSSDATSSEDDDDDFDYSSPSKRRSNCTEHSDPNSYSWCIMRYAICKLVLHKLITFLPTIGIEIPEIPVCSPLLQATLKTLEHWVHLLSARLELFPHPPVNYLPDSQVMPLPPDASSVDSLYKYKAMFSPTNTPFRAKGRGVMPVKRLWHCLVREKYLQDIFIRYLYKKSHYSPGASTEQTSVSADDSEDKDSTIAAPTKLRDPMKVVHKEQDVIHCFCLNQGNLNCIALATKKEVVELDISALLSPPQWLSDDTEYDIECATGSSPISSDNEDFVLLSTPYDNLSQFPPVISAPGAIPAPSSATTGHGATVLSRRPVAGTKKMGSHPHLPYYLTGAQDGSVRLFEWGHAQPLYIVKQSSNCKITQVAFSHQASKFGICDLDGNLMLWQLSLSSVGSRCYLNMRCHTRDMMDFTFLDSSSVLATVGYNPDGRNVCLWDTLMPQGRMIVQYFSAHEHGASAVAYAPLHQSLITAGKKGEVCIFDIRQQRLRHTFDAHESSVKSIALDPAEQLFVTGSANGNMKVWSLDKPELVHDLSGAHSKSGIFKQLGSGVYQAAVGIQGHLYSCGADGSMKVRYLQPE